MVLAYMDISQKASIGIVKFQRRLQSYMRPVCAGVLILLALMAFADKAPI